MLFTPSILIVFFLNQGPNEKRVLTYYFTDWCSACAIFKNDMAKDKEIQLVLGSVSLVQVNSSKASGKKIARKDGVFIYPTFVVSDTKGNVFDRWSGYSQKQFKKRLRRAIEEPLSVNEKEKSQKDIPSVANAIFLAQYFKSKREFTKSLDYYLQASMLKEDHCAYLEQKFEVSKYMFLFSSDLASFGRMEEILLSASDCVNTLPLALELADLALKYQFREKHREWIDLSHKVKQLKALEN